MTKKQWAGLDEKQQWDVIVALRGPDSFYGETLKWFTTSVIRGQMAPIMRVGGLVNEDLKLVILPFGPGPLSDETATTGWNYSHFLQHVQEAASNLELDSLYVPSVLWHKVMRLRSAAKAADELLSAAETFAREGAGKELSKYSGVWDSDAVAELRRHRIEGGVRF